jgi:hypothetical protein
MPHVNNRGGKFLAGDRGGFKNAPPGSSEYLEKKFGRDATVVNTTQQPREGTDGTRPKLFPLGGMFHADGETLQVLASLCNVTVQEFGSRYERN